MTRPDVLPSTIYTVSAPRIGIFRGSMAGLCAPLSTLRRNPRGQLRMTGVDVGRYSFIVRDLHSLLLAGLPALRKCFLLSPQQRTFIKAIVTSALAAADVAADSLGGLFVFIPNFLRMKEIR